MIFLFCSEELASCGSYCSVTPRASWTLCAARSGSPNAATPPPIERPAGCDRSVAEAKGCTVAQLAIAWVAAQGEDIVPLAGARTRERLAEALPAMDVTLTGDDLAEIEKAVPRGSARGDRYPSAMMAGLGVGN